MQTKNNKAFTLVEILVVVIIIGILAIALVPKIMSAQARTRDVKIKTDMVQIGNALVLYVNDTNASYPSYNQYRATLGGTQLNFNSGAWNVKYFSGLDSLLVPNYLSAMPKNSFGKNFYTLGIFLKDRIGDYDISYYGIGNGKLAKNNDSYGYIPVTYKRGVAEGKNFKHFILMSPVETIEAANWVITPDYTSANAYPFGMIQVGWFNEGYLAYLGEGFPGMVTHLNINTGGITNLTLDLNDFYTLLCGKVEYTTDGLSGNTSHIAIERNVVNKSAKSPPKCLIQNNLSYTWGNGYADVNPNTEKDSGLRYLHIQ